MELKRFYNSETNSVFRVLPLFQRINPISKRKNIIGVCWDSESGYFNWEIKDRDDYPNICKGQMVLLNEPKGNKQFYYKDEPLYELTEVINDYQNYVRINCVKHERYRWNSISQWENFT